MPIRILIADDDKTIRLLLRRILEAHAYWEVCADAADGKDAVEKAAQCQPDLIILDLAMPVMNGFQAAQHLSKNAPNIPLLLISVQQVTTHLERSARNVGFKGAITKSSGAEVVIAVEALLRSETFFALEGSSRIA